LGYPHTNTTRSYDSSHSWWQHELEAHRIVWQCIEGCEKIFTTQSSFDIHFEKDHENLVHMLQTIRRTSARSAELTKPEICTICQKSMPLKGLKKHIASHQQQLALFALPPNVDETEAEEPEDDKRSAITTESDEESLGVAEESSRANAGFSDYIDLTVSNPPSPQDSLDMAENDNTSQLASESSNETEGEERLLLSSDGSPRTDLDVEGVPSVSGHEMRLRVDDTLPLDRHLSSEIEEHTPQLVPDTLEKEKRIAAKQQSQLPSETLPSKIQPTYAKIHQKHLEIDTLHYYDIPYEFDGDPDYLIVLRELDYRETDVLFEHTRRLRSGKHPELFPRKEIESKKYSTEERSEATMTTQNAKTEQTPTPSFQKDSDVGNVRSRSQDPHSVSEEVATTEEKGESKVVEHILPPSTEEKQAAFWIPQATPDGRLFYFNTLTGVSTSELPLESPSPNKSDPRDHIPGSEPGKSSTATEIDVSKSHDTLQSSLLMPQSPCLY
jgi:hypothetical protein